LWILLHTQNCHDRDQGGKPAEETD
jgi:hypothetical protein